MDTLIAKQSINARGAALKLLATLNREPNWRDGILKPQLNSCTLQWPNGKEATISSDHEINRITTKNLTKEENTSILEIWNLINEKSTNKTTDTVTAYVALWGTGNRIGIGTRIITPTNECVEKFEGRCTNHKEDTLTIWLTACKAAIVQAKKNGAKQIWLAHDCDEIHQVMSGAKQARTPEMIKFLEEATANNCIGETKGNNIERNATNIAARIGADHTTVNWTIGKQKHKPQVINQTSAWAEQAKIECYKGNATAMLEAIKQSHDSKTTAQQCVIIAHTQNQENCACTAGIYLAELHQIGTSNVPKGKIYRDPHQQLEELTEWITEKRTDFGPEIVRIAVWAGAIDWLTDKIEKAEQPEILAKVAIKTAIATQNPKRLLDLIQINANQNWLEEREVFNLCVNEANQPCLETLQNWLENQNKYDTLTTITKRLISQGEISTPRAEGIKDIIGPKQINQIVTNEQAVLIR